MEGRILILNEAASRAGSRESPSKALREHRGKPDD